MTFPNDIGDRTNRAWQAILSTLHDGTWHTHEELVEAATQNSDLAPKSIDELIRKGYRTRHYTRRTSRIPGTRFIYLRAVLVDLKDGTR
jgi:hypothetical protein